MSQSTKDTLATPNLPAPATLKDIPLPHNIGIEQALLASLMNHEDAFIQISDTVNEADFYSPRHRLIFAAIAHLASINYPYDVVAVFDALQKSNQINDAGGEDYLTELQKSAAAAYNLDYYATTVREFAAYRALIANANTLLANAYHPKKRPLADILDEAESGLFAISESLNRRDGTQGLKEGIDVVQTVTEMIKAQQARPDGQLLGLPTSFTELDNKMQGLQNGDLIILAARPSMGKTSLALNIIQNVLIQKVPVVLFSMEMSAESIMMRLLATWAQVELGRLRSGYKLTQEDWSKISSGVAIIADSNLYIDDRNDLPPTEVRSVCRQIARKQERAQILEVEAGQRRAEDIKPLGLIVVDYLQLMKVPHLEGNRVAEISQISRNLKALAREMNCPVIALSQLSRKVEDRPNKRPIMSDLRESGAIEQDADVIMFIYRDEVYNKERADNKGIAEILVGKNRNGPIGKFLLKFDGRYTHFCDLDAASLDGYQVTDDN